MTIKQFLETTKQYIKTVRLWRNPSLDLWKVFPGMEHVQADFNRLSFPYRMVNTSPNDLYCICAMIKFLRPKNIFEFGTHSGMSTYQFAIKSESDALIHTLELEDHKFYSRFKNRYVNSDVVSEVGKQFKESPYKDKIKQLRGDSLHYNFKSLEATMDLIFVDGNHDRKYVEKDTENAFNMLSKNGVILWHDYHYPDVHIFLNNLAKTKKLYHINQTDLVLFKNKDLFLNA